MNTESFNIFEIDEKVEKQLFKDAIVFFDTSSLLDFYYYSESNSIEIFNTTFKALKKRIFITAHTEFEFFKNRKSVLQKPLKTYDNLLSISKYHKDSGHIDRINEVIKEIKNNINKNLKGQFNTLKEKTTKADKHPFIEPKIYLDIESKINLLSNYIEGFEKNFSTFKKELENEIDEKKRILETSQEEDKILEQLKSFISTTKGLNFEEIIELIPEGEIRYNNEMPPGYLDRDDKIGTQKYGDFIVWKELLIEAEKRKKDVILIINDFKEDWWNLDKSGNTIGPRHELIKEFHDQTGKRFWMYGINEFLHKSKQFLDTKLEETIIEEVKNVIKPWPLDDQEVIVDWIFSYFQNPAMLYFDDDKYDKGIDYELTTNDKKLIYFRHKKTKKGNYSNLLLPIRNVQNDIRILKKDYGFNRFVLVIECATLYIAHELTNQTAKKNIIKLLNDTSVNLQVLIIYPDNGSLTVYFDSKNKK